MAWRENLILEQYYRPVLENGHAWSTEQRQDAESRGRSLAGAYVSSAYPYRVYHWPSALHWAAVLALAGGLLALLRGSRQPSRATAAIVNRP